VDQGPLPPHERAWRHPSELGPPPHEPTSRSGRVLIASTATLGLLLVGILAITMTPRRSASPVAATSTALGLRGAPADDAAGGLPMVTPIGEDGWAVTTADALADVSGGTARVQLATGGVVVVRIVRTVDEVTVVSLPDGIDADAFDVSDARPSGDDPVVVHDEDEPFAVPMGELANADLQEATPVLDEEGRLLGLATGKPDAHWMVPVETVPPPPATTTTTSTTTTSTTVPSTTTVTSTTEPSTTVSPATSEPSTTPPTVPTTTATAPPTTAPPTTAPTTPPTSAPSTTPPTGGPGANGGTG
jgi:hypothetical protein